MSKTKTNNSWLNYCSTAMIHPVEANGKSWYNVSVECAKSKTGYISFSVNEKQVYTSTRKDGSEVEGMNNILLGKPDGVRKVSICTKKGRGKNHTGRTFERIQMTNAEIADLFTAAKDAYYSRQEAQE